MYESPWRWLGLAALSVALGSFAPIAHAKEDPAPAARKLYLRGTRHVEAGELGLARSAYRRSFDL